MRVDAARFGRRRLLKIAGGAALAAAGAVALVRTSGYPAPPRRLASLSASQYAVAQHAARRITAPDRADSSIPTADDLDVAGFIDAWLPRMRAPVRRDFGRFLAFIEHLAPIQAGYAARFTRLDPADQDRVLQGIEASSSELLRAGFDGLKSLCFMGYYRDPRAWAIAGYDGPLVGRPPEGWSAGGGP
ncbi:MAG TPA: gluconate 2-dehydrogenase subunit 3 family protein [Polyangiaceae bacterium]|jgi:hypothetical protein|nr:gluconate 2-dehydrogenase subunit 3 family protein [Polyangiaceae bacterium]